MLLQYPTAALFDGPGRARRRAPRRRPRRSRPARRSGGSWPGCGPHRPTEVAQHYVETFDLRRRCALYLTYYRYGDTRKRGMAMLGFKTAYRAAGFVPCEDELPDYLPMVLDFAALRPRGERLLRAHRARPGAAAPRPAPRPRHRTPTWSDAVCAQLPQARAPGARPGARSTGNPARRSEDVGLEPFAPPEYLTGGRPTDRTTRPNLRGGLAMNGVSAAEIFWWVVAALPGARRLRRRARLALALRPVRLDQPLHPAAGTADAQVGRRRCSTTRTFAAIAGHVLGILIPADWTEFDRHPRERLPTVLRHRRHARGRPGDRRRGRPGDPPPVRARGCGPPPRPSTSSR